MLEGGTNKIKESRMTTSFLGLSYWELLGTFNGGRIAMKRRFGKKLSHFGHTRFEGLVGHPRKGVLWIARIKS